MCSILYIVVSLPPFYSLSVSRLLSLYLSANRQKSCYGILFCRCLKSIPNVRSSFSGTSYSTQLFMKLSGLLAVHVNTSYRLSLHAPLPFPFSHSYFAMRTRIRIRIRTCIRIRIRTRTRIRIPFPIRVLSVH